MKRLAAAVSILVGAGLLASVALSQEGRGAQEKPGMGGMHQEQGMQGMMGMEGCPMMSSSGQTARGGQTAGGGLIPRLPPGNEKLQAQMTAEILQKAGEIASKYAAQAK